jgi:hypothetical protein
VTLENPCLIGEYKVLHKRLKVGIAAVEMAFMSG